MLVPIYGFLRGDTIGLLVLVHHDEPVRVLAERLRDAASVRVRPAPIVEVRHEGRSLDLDSTVASAGLTALERVDVVTEEPA